MKAERMLILQVSGATPGRTSKGRGLGQRIRMRVQLRIKAKKEMSKMRWGLA